MTGARRQRVSLPTWWPVACLTLAAAVLRGATLAAQSFWYDEMLTASMVRRDFTDMLAHLTHDAHPPTYYVVAWLWTKLAGSGEVGLRSLSAVLGVATVPVAYVIGGQLASRRAGILLAALVTFSPFMVWYSQEARGYALLVLFGALSFLCFLRALRAPSPRLVIGWVAFSVLAVATHYFAAAFVAVEALWLIVALRGRRAVLVAVAGVALAGLALLPLALAQVDRGLVSWLEPLKLRPRLREALGWFLGGPYLGLHQPLTTPVALLWIVEALIASCAIWLLLTRSPKRDRAAAAVCCGVGAGALTLAFALAATGLDYILGRYLILSWVPLAGVVAVAFALQSPRRLGGVAASVACGLWLVVLAVTAVNPRYQRDDWRLAAETLGEPSGTRVIVVKGVAGSPRDSLLFYLRGARELTRRSVSVTEVAIVDMRRSRWARPPVPPPATARVERVGDDNVRVSRFILARSTRMVVTRAPDRAPPNAIAIRPGPPNSTCPCSRVLLIERAAGTVSLHSRAELPAPTSL